MTAPHELRQLRHTPLHSPPLCASSSRFSVEGRFSCSGVAAQPSGLVEVYESQRAWLRAQIDPVPPLDVSEDFV